MWDCFGGVGNFLEELCSCLSGAVRKKPLSYEAADGRTRLKCAASASVLWFDGRNVSVARWEGCRQG